MNLLKRREEELRKKVWLAMDLIEKQGIFIHSEYLEIAVNDKVHRIPLVLGLTILNALVGNGSMILYGGYGYGKTTLLKYLGRVLTGYELEEIESSILRANPQLTEEKIVGRLELGELIKEGREKIIWRNFILRFWKIIDEINRLSPAAQDVILSLLGEGIAKYFDATYKSDYYVLYATLNPRDVGTFPVGLPVLDRFGIALIVRSPSMSDLEVISESPDDRILKRDIPALLSVDDLVDIWGFVEGIPLDEEARMFITVLLKEISLCDRVEKETGIMLSLGAKICLGCPFEALDSICKYSYTPLSIRAQKDLIRYSKALAWLLGERKVTLSMVTKLAPFVIWHRLRFSERYLEEFGYNYFSFAKKIVEDALRLYIKNLPLIQAFRKLKFGEVDAKMISNVKKAKDSDLLIKYEVEPYVDELLESEYMSIASKIRDAALGGRDGEIKELITYARENLSASQYRLLRNAIREYLQGDMRIFVVPRDMLDSIVETLVSAFNIKIPTLSSAPMSLRIEKEAIIVEVNVISNRAKSPAVLKIGAVNKSVLEKIVRQLGVYNAEKIHAEEGS